MKKIKIILMAFIAMTYFSSCQEEVDIQDPQLLDEESRRMPDAGEEDQCWIIDDNTGDWGWGPCPNDDDPHICDNSMALATHYAPYLYLAQDEPYQPSSVEWFLSRANVWHKITDFEACHASQSCLTPDNLDDQFEYYLHDGTWRAEYSSQPDNNFYVYPKIDGKETTRKGDLASSKVYVHTYTGLSKGSPNDLYIQYWFFYPYNGPLQNNSGLITGGAHEGDWEHITVKVKNGCDISPILAVYYAAHGSEGRWYDADEIEYFGHRPVVYSAYHSHASYPFADTWVRRFPPLNLTQINDHTSAGTLIATGDRLIIAESEIDIAPIPGWVNFRGRWGRGIGTNSDQNPYGPDGLKTRYNPATGKKDMWLYEYL